MHRTDFIGNAASERCVDAYAARMNNDARNDEMTTARRSQMGYTVVSRTLIARTLAVLLLGLLLVAAIVLVRTVVAVKDRAPAKPLAYTVPDADTAVAVTHLSRALQFETVSFDDRSNASALESLRAWLMETYPRFHALARRTVVADATLIYEWVGSDSSLAPIVLMAHQDVVPVPEPERWKQPPFSGAVVDGFIWGRGALDDKSSLIAIMEAAESLVANGHVPQRTIYFVFGHDEESAGTGARAAGDVLEQRKIRAAFVLDEGSLSITDNPVTGQPVTLIAIAEKGYLTLELAVSAAGGHSNSPPPETAVDTLAKAIVAIRKSPMSTRYDGVTKAMLEAMAPDASLITRMTIANSWLFDRLIVGQLSANPATAAMLQTTVAPTMLQGSPKQNVLPSVATARINFRVLPGDTTDGVIAHVRKSLEGLPVTVTAVGLRTEPSAISSLQSAGYRLVSGIAQSLFDAPVVPTMSIGLTDSRSLRGITDDIYLFAPIRTRLGDLAMVHGIDERISTENLSRMVVFYQNVIVGGSAHTLP
jgi:carboxypeptidase PM20D1